MKHSIFAPLLASLGLSFALTLLAQGQTFPSADVPAGTAVADGVIEAAWDSVPAIALTVDIDGTSPTATDFSGYWKAMWDANALYLLCVTTDDTTVAYPGSQFWTFDMTELFIDFDNSKDTAYDGVNDIQIVFPRGGEPAFVNGANPLGLTVPFAESGLSSADGTVVLEVVIPWAETGVGPAAGTMIGLDVYMKDNDSGNAVRKNQLSWSPSGDQAYLDPSLFGTVTLVDQLPNWYGYPVDQNNWADTGSWLGWVNVEYSPWIYSGSQEVWIFVSNPASISSAAGTWLYILR